MLRGLPQAGGMLVAQERPARGQGEPGAPHRSREAVCPAEAVRVELRIGLDLFLDV